MRSTTSFAYRSPRIGFGKSASSAFAYRVASMVCGAPLRSTGTRAVITPHEASPAPSAAPRPEQRSAWRSAGSRAPALGISHRHPEPGGLADGFVDGTRLPIQFALGLAAVDVGFGAHHAHRREAEFGVLTGEA